MCQDTSAGVDGFVALGRSNRHTKEVLQKYIASYNRITDRTPEILSGIGSLEQVTFDSCARLTNAGIAHLARLPRLRELRVESMPRVTAEVGMAFGPEVTVTFWT